VHGFLVWALQPAADGYELFWAIHGRPVNAWTAPYLALIERLRPLVSDGLSAAVYTQTTDVEIEVNGLMTYDRGLVKMDAAAIAAANRRMYSLSR
jgi:hypothetical protein